MLYRSDANDFVSTRMYITILQVTVKAVELMYSADFQYVNVHISAVGAVDELYVDVATASQCGCSCDSVLCCIKTVVVSNT
jgi:hypothetical protein